MRYFDFWSDNDSRKSTSRSVFTLANLFAKTLPEKVSMGNIEGLGLRDMSHLL